MLIITAKTERLTLISSCMDCKQKYVIVINITINLTYSLWVIIKSSMVKVAKPNLKIVCDD